MIINRICLEGLIHILKEEFFRKLWLYQILLYYLLVLYFIYALLKIEMRIYSIRPVNGPSRGGTLISLIGTGFVETEN